MASRRRLSPGFSARARPSPRERFSRRLGTCQDLRPARVAPLQDGGPQVSSGASWSFFGAVGWGGCPAACLAATPAPPTEAGSTRPSCDSRKLSSTATPPSSSWRRDSRVCVYGGRRRGSGDTEKEGICPEPHSHPQKPSSRPAAVLGWFQGWAVRGRALYHTWKWANLGSFKYLLILGQFSSCRKVANTEQRLPVHRCPGACEQLTPRHNLGPN